MVPLLALSIALTCFSVAFWVTKKGVFRGREGGGSLANMMALSHLPSSFTVIKMNRFLRGWAEVRASHLTSHKLTTREVNVKLMRKGGGLVNPTCRQTLRPFLVIHCATSAQPCSCKASLNRPSVLPPVRKVMHFKNQTAQVELSTERGHSVAPVPMKAGGGVWNKVLLTRNTQTANR